MRDVISDSSPLQYLYQAGLLDLLPRLYRHVYVPAAVAAELDAGRRLGVSLPELEALQWLEVRPVGDAQLLPSAATLGAGEKEVIALGLEMPGVLILLDDREARRHAKANSLEVSGTLGVLLLSKERGLVDAVRPVLTRLEEQGFRLDIRTRMTVLKLAGEESG